MGGGSGYIRFTGNFNRPRLRTRKAKIKSKHNEACGKLVIAASHGVLGQFGVNFFEIADYVCEKGKKGKKEKEARRARFFFCFFFW